MTVWNVTGVVHSDKPTEEKLIISWLQFPSALRSFIASFSSLFWFSGLQIDCFGSGNLISSSSCFSDSSDKSEYLTYICLVVRNMKSNECWCYSVCARCVNKQQFANMWWRNINSCSFKNTEYQSCSFTLQAIANCHLMYCMPTC